MPFIDSLNALIVLLADSPWVYLVAFLVVLIDGFFPPLPSESAVVALGALAMASGSPHLIGLIVVVAAGAAAGDAVAYAIGRGLGGRQFRWMQRPRVLAAIERAMFALDRRAATLLLTARFIPVGRVAVNMTAGATGFSFRRFLPLAALAGLCWSVYSVLIGVLAGAWLTHNPALGAVLAVVLAVVVGFMLDVVISRLARRRETPRSASSEPDDAARPPALAIVATTGG
ncbi:DedA family protein [Glaciibacter psychrotolerans]|uniref:Membrane protein DedA with SNARE-associated domain n=1 Tax=Glaciibacter psychrotolerans TaxID=670054 RepID=A0A7Z0J4J2_9MICO|nr:VTT domain-containing protein [Leifsonia psychrotolerans]NYJ18395.1 membrane protein DedA with SNARE-associated domain [Leifsonia psychrotolerans]